MKHFPRALFVVCLLVVQACVDARAEPDGTGTTMSPGAGLPTGTGGTGPIGGNAMPPAGVAGAGAVGGAASPGVAGNVAPTAPVAGGAADPPVVQPTGTGSMPAMMPAPGAPTYTAVYEELLEPLGCTTAFCHGASGLMLEAPETGYTNLMEGTPNSDPACASMKFVVPGDPMKSYLYVKVQPSPPCGQQMPIGKPPLTDAQLTQLRKWIEMGAKND